MRYHLFQNSIRKMFKTAKVFSRKLTVKFQASTTVIERPKESMLLSLSVRHLQAVFVLSAIRFIASYESMKAQEFLCKGAYSVT